MNIKPTLLVVFVLIASLWAQGQVIIYKITGSEKRTGGSQTVTDPMTGLLAYYPSARTVACVYAFPREHSYHVTAPWTVATLIGENQTDFTAFSQSLDVLDAAAMPYQYGFLAKGQNAELNSGAGICRAPRLMTLSGRFLHSIAGGISMMAEETTATLTVDLARSRLYNSGSLTNNVITSGYAGWTQF